MLKEKVCQVCGDVFKTATDDDYCQLPRMCRYQQKDNKYVTIVDVKGNVYGDGCYYYVLHCKICQNEFEAVRAQFSRTGYSPHCDCVTKYDKERDEGSKEWQALSDRPRVENKANLTKLSSLEKDDSYKVEACMNCAKFETTECNLTDIDLCLKIDLESHICDKFRWRE